MTTWYKLFIVIVTTAFYAEWIPSIRGHHPLLSLCPGSVWVATLCVWASHNWLLHTSPENLVPAQMNGPISHCMAVMNLMCVWIPTLLFSCRCYCCRLRNRARHGEIVADDKCFCGFASVQLQSPEQNLRKKDIMHVSFENDVSLSISCGVLYRQITFFANCPCGWMHVCNVLRWVLKNTKCVGFILLQIGNSNRLFADITVYYHCSVKCHTTQKLLITSVCSFCLLDCFYILIAVLSGTIRALRWPWEACHCTVHSRYSIIQGKYPYWNTCLLHELKLMVQVHTVAFEYYRMFWLIWQYHLRSYPFLVWKRPMYTMYVYITKHHPLVCCYGCGCYSPRACMKLQKGFWTNYCITRNQY